MYYTHRISFQIYRGVVRFEEAPGAEDPDRAPSCYYLLREKKNDGKKTKSDERRTNDDDRRTVKRQKGERKSGDRRTNDDDKRTVKRQKGERKSDERRTNDDGRRTVRRQKGETKSDDKRTEKKLRGDIRKSVGLKFNRIEKEFQENKEEIERKLEDTRRQVQKEILERIEGLGHQLHRTSITGLGDGSTSPDTPLQHSSLMHTERSVHKMLKPPTYDGQSSWSMYRRQFEAAAKANGWTPQEMATSLVISLRGQALEILQSIPEEQQNDYDRIVGALEIRYGHKYLRQVYQSQIKSRQQRSNESLQEYEADIERLIHLAYPQAPKEFLEQIGIQTFIDGLVDTEMQQALRLGRHATISDALIAALEFKAAKEASRNYKPKVRQVTFDEQTHHKRRQEAAITVGELGIYNAFAEPDLGPSQELTHQTDNRRRDPDLGAQINEAGEKTKGPHNKGIVGLRTGIVEASERNDGLLVARSLVQINNQIPVRIANISDKKIILKKNEVLGRCEPVEKIVKCEEVNQARTNQARLSPRSKAKVVHLERLAKYTGHNPPNWFVVEDPPPRTEDSVIRDE
ncbi:hypothetical protein NQ318_010354 [Aromia moschata]|uniref:Retrotransposon gag domain-containing protein n=1 Tax=Aromia moschata TaxID=1265417 RepID=A0AAV8YBA4_9CUCU|nr:hypothetical protein NQ318_010354 [Aromia moschata]